MLGYVSINDHDDDEVACATIPSSGNSFWHFEFILYLKGLFCTLWERTNRATEPANRVGAEQKPRFQQQEAGRQGPGPHAPCHATRPAPLLCAFQPQAVASVAQQCLSLGLQTLTLDTRPIQ